jgi:hypothetical protein
MEPSIWRWARRALSASAASYPQIMRRLSADSRLHGQVMP